MGLVFIIRYFCLLFFSCILISGCNASREFWRYVVEESVAKPITEGREKGTADTPKMISDHNVRVVYSDGATSTEVYIPVLTSGQQIVIDHKNQGSPRSLSVVPLPPVDADKAIENSYLQKGQQVSNKEAPVSLVRTSEQIRQLVKDGNLSLALEYAEQLLKRYPSHVKTLRTKGSLLLKLGERDAALETYQKAQSVEFDPRVEEQIKNLENAINEGR